MNRQPYIVTTCELMGADNIPDVVHMSPQYALVVLSAARHNTEHHASSHNVLWCVQVWKVFRIPWPKAVCSEDAGDWIRM